MTVYVVDNDPGRAALVELFDRREGWTVVGSSTSADEAAAEIVRLGPQVVVVDAALADGDGLELCRVVKAALPSVRCVVTSTGLRGEHGPDAASEAGADAFLVKSLTSFPLVDVARCLVCGAQATG